MNSSIVMRIMKLYVYDEGMRQTDTTKLASLSGTEKYGIVASTTAWWPALVTASISEKSGSSRVAAPSSLRKLLAFQKVVFAMSACSEEVIAVTRHPAITSLPGFVGSLAADLACSSMSAGSTVALGTSRYSSRAMLAGARMSTSSSCRSYGKRPGG